MSEDRTAGIPDGRGGPDALAGFRSRLGGIGFGGDYNPEQWAPDLWREDVRLMREAGVNVVTLGVFAWSWLEPEPGRFEFDGMDEVMALLHEGGICVDLATPTAVPPAWLVQRHPEMLPVMEDGEVFGFGNRLHFDPSSPVYREHAAAIVRALAERYAQHPAVSMWHIGNEFGPVSYTSESSVAFRRWLEERYGDLDALNDAWYTRFWGQTYTDWEQVEVPAVPRSSSNPARRLDYRRFPSDAMLECFVAERDIVRSYRSDVPIVTNFMRFYKHADYWRWAREENAAALDIYPDPGRPDSRVAAALNFDLMRSLKRGPWLLMEQAASAVSQWRVNNVKRPGLMRLGSYQAVAHGADSVQFFQWRASRGGHERFHSAMLPHSGTASRTWQEVRGLGRELGRISEVAGTRSDAEVAVLFDWDAWWGLVDSHGLPRNDFDYPELVTEHYRPFLEHRIPVDVVSYDSDLSRYRLVVIPNAYLVSDRFITELERFAAAGGTVVTSFFSGIVDENNQVRQPAYPGGFRRLIGCYIDEFQPARGGERFDLRFAPGAEPGGERRGGADAGGATAGASWWQDSIRLESATALAAYSSGLQAGRPAITENRALGGRVVHLGTRLDPDALDRLLVGVAADAGAASVLPAAPPWVEATVRVSESHRYLFLLNHSETEAADLTLPWPGEDLLAEEPTGRSEAAGGRVMLQPCGVAVLRSPLPG